MEFEKKSIELPHCQTEAISAGTGEPVTVVTSGGLDGGYEWPVDSGLGEGLAKIGTFIGWNRRFNENAKGPLCIQTIETNAIDLIHVMDAYGIDAAHLVGCSFGSSTSLMAAFWYPKRVEKLVLYIPTRISDEALMRNLDEKVQRWKTVLLEQGVAAALRMEEFCYPSASERDDLNGGVASDVGADEFATIIEESYRRFGTHRCTVLGLPASMLRLIDNEALIIAGSDEIHPPEAAADLVELMPNGRTAENSYNAEGMSPALRQEIVEFLSP